MNQAIVKYYRQLLKEDFPYSGELEKPSVFVEAVGEKMVHCGNAGNYMQLYFNVADERITGIRYLCSCEPVANVAVEIMCALAEGKTLDEAAALPESLFYERLGRNGFDRADTANDTDDANASDDADTAGLRLKVRGLMELLREGIASYRHAGTEKKPSETNIQWDLLGSPLSLTGKMS